MSASRGPSVAVVGVGSRLADGDCAPGFDAPFFGLSPREAETLRPWHRQFFECAWEALETAGCVPGRTGETIGVFAGLEGEGAGAHLRAQPALAAGRFQSMLGGDPDYLATRVSHRFGLTGPSLCVASGGAAPLAAVHLAAESLLAGEVDGALAGGGGSGGLPGMGVVLLKRLDDALAEGHPIQGVIRGSAVSHDGRLKGAERTGRARAAGLAGAPPDLAAAGGISGLIRTLLDLQGVAAAGRRGVAASSAGGANAYVLLEALPDSGARPVGGAARPWQALVLSAATEEALDQVTARLAEHLRRHPELDLGDVAHTLQTGRKSLRCRRALVVRGLAEAVEKLERREEVFLEPGGREPDLGDDPESLCRRWLAGRPVDWRAVHAGERRRLVPLPTYPFERGAGAR